jgi:hypothetical protein
MVAMYARLYIFLRRAHIRIPSSVVYPPSSRPVSENIQENDEDMVDEETGDNDLERNGPPEPHPGILSSVGSSQQRSGKSKAQLKRVRVYCNIPLDIGYI